MKEGAEMVGIALLSSFGMLVSHASPKYQNINYALQLSLAGRVQVGREDFVERSRLLDEAFVIRYGHGDPNMRSNGQTEINV